MTFNKFNPRCIKRKTRDTRDTAELLTVLIEKWERDQIKKLPDGWRIDFAYDKKIIQHSGGTPGFGAIIMRVPQDKTGILILENRPSQITPGETANDINSLLNGKENEKPKQISTAKRVTNRFGNGIIVLITVFFGVAFVLTGFLYYKIRKK